MVTIDKLQKATNGKYANAQLKYIGVNKDDQKIVYFRIVFAEDSKETEVVTSLNTKTYVLEIVSEKSLADGAKVSGEKSEPQEPTV